MKITAIAEALNHRCGKFSAGRNTKKVKNEMEEKKMKFNLGKTINLLLAVCMVLNLALVFSLSVSALDVHVTITDSMSAADIGGTIQSAIDRVKPGNSVTITGYKDNEQAKIVLKVPAGITVLWKAISNDLSFSIDGGGTFEVAAGGEIKATGVAIHVDNGDVVISGGEVSATGDYSAAIEVIKGDVTVTGGKVSASMDFGHGCYAICIGDYFTPGASGTATITGGNVSASSVFGDSFAISLQNGGLAAYFAGTCVGDFEVWGAGIVVEVDTLTIPSSYGGTTNGLTSKAGSAISTVKWDLSGDAPVISFNSGQYAVEWVNLTDIPPVNPVDHPVRIQETGGLFDTIKDAVTAAENAGLDTFTLEIIGDVTEAGNTVITSNVTITGAEGAHTVTLPLNYSVSVQGSGGSLTLGSGADTNPLTFSGLVNVTDGPVNITDGVVFQNTVLYTGINATGAISGGRFEGTGGRVSVGLSLEKGAQISEIGGGVFLGKNDAVHLSDAGTRIGKISGGVFYQTDPDIQLHGYAVFVQNYSEIGEISGGYFDAVRNCALILIRGGKVGEISGGEFVAHRSGTIANDDRNAAIWVENGWKSEGFVGTGIGTISGGHIKGTNFGLLLIADYGYSYVDYITGGIFEGVVALQNDRGSTITEISGGKMIGNQGILNVGKIGKIGGSVDILGKTSYAIYNYSSGQIDEIGGGTFVSEKSDGIANAGVIKLISGGRIIGRYSAINCDGLNKGRLEVITNGVFLGTYDKAIRLAYPLTLEPGLSAEKGFGRYWGKDGVVFNNENLVVYPGDYFMSTRTEPVAGIAEVEFKYLTLSDRVYEVTFNTNGGRLEDGATTTMREVPPPETTVGETNMPEDPVRDGYTFIGWNTEKDGSGDTFTAATTVTGDVTVYAQWKHDGDGGNGGNGGDGGNGGGGQDIDPPDIEIPGKETPLTPFITEHTAYVIGYPDGSVGPGRNMTRAEASTLFFRLLTDEIRAQNWTQDNPFSDVQKDMWFNNAISVMYSMGIVQGYPDGTFRPNESITRAELAAMAARFAREMQMEPSNGMYFSDIAGHWAEDDILFAAAIGWVNGLSGGRFEPDQNITRAEAMTLVNRMLERVPETADDLLGDDMVVWPDNADPGAWYYLAVQEATNSHLHEYKDETVPGLPFSYEYWLEMMPNRDWAQLEREWSTAMSG